MSDDKQPEALRLADMNEATNDESAASVRLVLRAKSAAELRRQHAELIAKNAAIAELVEALRDLTLNVSEAMKTGGWVPTPLHKSFWYAMSECLDAIAKHGAAS